ncbi:MAG: efflux RND transporter periplasmic adaptor subunit [Methylocystis sp.]
MSRKLPVVLAMLVGMFVGSFLPRFSETVRSLVAPRSGPNATKEESKGPNSPDGQIKLSDEQIAAANIEIAAAASGALARRVTVPALVTPDPDRVARVAAKVAGTVAELRKKLGDPVLKGEVVAVIDSREVADAKSEFLAAAVNYDLQNTLFAREKGLFEKKITAEQIFLKAKTNFAEAKLRLDLARQKLASLDLSESEISALAQQPMSALRRKDIHAPISGRVIERLVSLGQPVGGEGQAKELYVLADLSVVEADLAIPVADLPLVREKQSVSLATPEGRDVDGAVVFVNAMLTPETRTGHAIASFENAEHLLRPGSLLNAKIALSKTPVAVKVPRAAVQMVNNDATVFVRTAEGFMKRKVETGESDDDSVEIRSGLAASELIATTNTFVLKAEAGKADIPEE